MLNNPSGDLASAAGASAAQTAPIINYETMTGPLVPTSGPYVFNDGLVTYTESQLQSMTIDQLLAYSNDVSKSAQNQYSTIIENENLLNQYNILSGLSDSTITGIKNQLQTNNSALDASRQKQAYLSEKSSISLSNISKYKSIIDTQTDIINKGNSSISSYSLQISSLYSTIFRNDSTYMSSAVGYYTVYYKYLGWLELVDKNNKDIEDQNRILNESMLEAERTSSILSISTATWLQKTNELSTLNAVSLNLNAKLREQKINEAQAEFNYKSTLCGLSTLNEIYTAAVANNKYSIALSTQKYLEKQYINAVTIFTNADILYQNSVPPGGASGGTIPGNNTLWQARLLAQQALQTAKQKVSVAESTTSTLQTLAGIKNTDLYNSMLNALEETVINNLYLANKFKNYKLSSLDAVKYWSTVYESSAKDISTSVGKVKMYSSFYESSMIGGSTLLGLAAKDRSKIAEQQMNADAVQKTIDRLKTDYDAYMSSYNSYIKTSSFHADQVINEAFRLSTISSLYVSTQKGIDIMKKYYDDLMLDKITYNATLYSQSSILNRSLINLATYDAQIKNNVNTIELTSYQYRETYSLVKRINVQSNYESLVLQAIQNASTLTSQLGSSQPADLTTLNIPVVYNKLTSVNSFLDSFSQVYSAYNTQGNNLDALSTSIGYQSNSWSTLQNYTDALHRESPDTSVENILPKINSGNTDFSLKKDIVLEQLRTYSTQQQVITGIKEKFITAYSTLFTESEIIAQESTISSFMINGYNQGIANLAKNGIVFSL